MPSFKSRIFPLLCMSLAFGGQRSSQGQEKPKFSIELLRVNFETGIPYQPVARATFGCASRDWSVGIDWGDGGPVEMLSHPVEAGPGGATPAGTHDVSGNHSYARAGSYSVDAQLEVRCFDPNYFPLSKNGPPPQGGDKEKYTVNVFERIPVKDITTETSSVSKGTPIYLTLTLRAPAPASGTRILIQSDKSRGVFPEKYLPAVIEIPEHSDHAQLNIPTLRDAAIGAVTITAVAVDGSHTVKINIR